MVDLSLMKSLLDALPKETQLVLVGDPNQLSPIDSGAVWGRMLTAFCLETEKITQVSSHKKDLPS